MDRPLEGKVVLVSGGGVRLGRAIAEGLGASGAAVAVHCHASRQGAEEAAAVIRADGNRAGVFPADLRKEEEIEALVARVEAELGPIAVLVNSAALFLRADFLTTSTRVLDEQWQVNARGPYLLTQAVARRMSARGGGDVVNVLDVGGALQAWRHYTAYGMTKAALASLTHSLALELAPAVRVNAVAPGTVLPPEGLPPEVLAALKERIPQRRFGTPEDVVAAVRFLVCGPRFVTGQILAVDGGRSIHGGNG
ncbi:MAG: SDR family NAD(P)-dependent oxidoreductase [Myxococcota bacterium]